MTREIYSRKKLSLTDKDVDCGGGRQRESRRSGAVQVHIVFPCGLKQHLFEQIRPLIPKELKDKEQIAVVKPNNPDHEIKVGDRVFTFDYAFQSQAQQVC